MIPADSGEVGERATTIITTRDTKSTDRTALHCTALHSPAPALHYSEHCAALQRTGDQVLDSCKTGLTGPQSIIHSHTLTRTNCVRMLGRNNRAKTPRTSQTCRKPL